MHSLIATKENPETKFPVATKKIIIVTSPSGGGKGEICKTLLASTHPNLNLEFSISACNREKRPGEVNGVDYWFKENGEFLQMIKDNEFLEHEEVYPGSGKRYGTPVSEIIRVMHENGHHMLLDVDIKGAVSIKKIYPDAKIIFLKPPSINELRRRLLDRGTDSFESISERVTKAEQQIAEAEYLAGQGVITAVVVNDDLGKCKKAVLNMVATLLGLGRRA